MAHAAAQIVLIREQANIGGFETGSELAGLQLVIEDHRAVGLGQADEMLEPQFGDGYRFGQVHLVFDGGVGVMKPALAQAQEKDGAVAALPHQFQQCLEAGHDPGPG